MKNYFTKKKKKPPTPTDPPSREKARAMELAEEIERLAQDLRVKTKALQEEVQKTQQGHESYE